MRVDVWTVNSPEVMREVINMGVDGVITDYPDRLISILNH
jgi:glycerophosphoryl diester phosphodiesterase